VGKKKQVYGCEGTVAGMGSHSIAFLCGGVSFVFSVYMQQSCLTRFSLHCLVLTFWLVCAVPIYAIFFYQKRTTRIGMACTSLL
jgi:hypothetical protein